MGRFGITVVFKLIALGAGGFVLERPDPCTWPECGADCLPCTDSISSGSCSTDDALANASCGPAGFNASDNGTVHGQCIIVDPESVSKVATCICPKGYCADETGVCLERVCWRGADPPPFEASWTAWALSKLAVGAVVPERTQDQSFQKQWVGYLLGSSCVPLAFLVIGLSTTFLSCVCIAKPLCFRACGKICSCPCQAFCGMSDTALWWLSFVLAMLILFLGVFGFLEGRHASEAYNDSLSDATSFSTHTAEQMVGMVHEISQLVHDFIAMLFHDVPDNCPWPIPEVLDSALKNQKTILEAAQFGLGLFNSNVDPIYTIIRTSHPIVKGLLLGYTKLGLLPLLFMMIVSLWYVCTLFGIATQNYMCRGKKERCFTRHINRCHKFTNNFTEKVEGVTLAWCNVCFVIFSSYFLASAITLGGFCSNPDYQILGITGKQSGAETNLDWHLEDSKVANYYLKGEYANPWRLKIASVYESFNQTRTQLTEPLLHSALSFSGWICPVFNRSIVIEMLESPMERLQNLSSQLSVGNVWPHYNELVRKGVCRKAMFSLGVSALITTMSTTCLWPLFICTFSMYLKKWKSSKPDKFGDDDDEEKTDGSDVEGLLSDPDEEE